MRFTEQLKKTFTNKGLEPYRYDNGKIYKLVSGFTKDVYIGSTIQSLKQRLRKHMNSDDTKSRCLKSLGAIKIVLIENYPCKNRKELERREGYWQQKYKHCINKNLAGRTYNEWKKDNPEKMKIYREKDKEKIKCVCGGVYMKKHKYRHPTSNKHLKYLNTL